MHGDFNDRQKMQWCLSPEIVRALEDHRAFEKSGSRVGCALLVAFVKCCMGREHAHTAWAAGITLVLWDCR